MDLVSEANQINKNYKYIPYRNVLKSKFSIDFNFLILVVHHGITVSVNCCQVIQPAMKETKFHFNDNLWKGEKFKI